VANQGLPGAHGFVAFLTVIKEGVWEVTALNVVLAVVFGSVGKAVADGAGGEAGLVGHDVLPQIGRGGHAA